MVAVGIVAVLRQEQVAHNPVAALAARRAAVDVTGSVASDPRVVSGGFGTTVVVRLSVRSVQVRGTRVRLRAPVLVLGDQEWRRLPLGATVRVDGRLAPADDPQESAVLTPRGPVRVQRAPGPWWRGAAAVRASIRSSVADRAVEPRALVPALVDGDDADVPAGLAEDFKATGLTHLLAVSGTN